MRPPLSAVGKKHGRLACVKGRKVPLLRNLGGTTEYDFIKLRPLLGRGFFILEELI